jgi:hypothetical protein
MASQLTTRYITSHASHQYAPESDNIMVINVPNGHPTECLSGRHTSGVGRTQVLSHAILATTTRGSKIILLFKVCT